MPELLAAIEIETAKNPSASIIWLHGLGADGNDFAPIVPELRLPKTAIRFVFPHAPVRPVTINGGMRMRAWYDITDGANRREDGMPHSVCPEELADIGAWLVKVLGPEA